MENKIEPYIGMPVTYQIGSDRYAYYIVKMSASGKTVWLNADHGNKETKFTLRKNGFYREANHKCGLLRLGIAITELDREF
jgi:hypothetical protein